MSNTARPFFHGSCIVKRTHSWHINEMSKHFDIECAKISLKDFQTHFAEINARLSLHREALTDDLIDNMLKAYAFLNTLVHKEIDLFSLAGLHSMLELNHIVLCGTDPAERFEYHEHIVETRKRFHEHIEVPRRWVLKKKKALSPVALASGFYCRILSQPQLFFEGNHRTGNILLNHMLVTNDHAPFLIDADTAYEYLELSSRIKLSSKKSTGDRFFKHPACEKSFEELLTRHAHERWLKKK